MLSSPTKSTTVSSVATQCGFVNQGHFAKDYRGKFNEAPSETLARFKSLAV